MFCFIYAGFLRQQFNNSFVEKAYFRAKKQINAMGLLGLSKLHKALIIRPPTVCSGISGGSRFYVFKEILSKAETTNCKRRR